MFSKELFFLADADRSKCLHVTSSNAPFCMHYLDDVNYCSLIMVMFPWEKVKVILEMKIKARVDPTC